MGDTRRIAVVDDDRLVLMLLAEQLPARGLEVVWSAASGAEALSRLEGGRAEHLDLLVVDVRMPGMDGFELVERARGIAPQLPVVMMSSSGDTLAVGTATSIGVTGFVEKPSDLDRFARALIDAAAGVRVFPHLPDGWEKLIPGNTCGLTGREIEVLRLLSERLENHEIAERLVLSPHTVKRHIANILRKMRVPSRRAAVKDGVRLGLVGRHWPD